MNYHWNWGVFLQTTPDGSATYVDWLISGLGWTVSVISNASYGAPVLQARLLYPNRNEARIEVKQGSLEALPLPLGQTARLTLQPLHRADIGYGPGRSHTRTVTGGALGVVVDARGLAVSRHRVLGFRGLRRGVPKATLERVGEIDRVPGRGDIDVFGN